jgi:hypothetical protein
MLPETFETLIRPVEDPWQYPLEPNTASPIKQPDSEKIPFVERLKAVELMIFDTFAICY